MLLLVVLHVVGAPAWAGEIADRQAIVDEVGGLLAGEDFDALEALAEAYRDPAQRLNSGVWKLERFYKGVSDAFHGKDRDDPSWQRNDALVSRWLAAYPHSPTPHLASAILQLRHGGSYRGGDYARNVPEANWEPFYRHVIAAGELLLASKDVAARDPHWYVLMQEVARLTTAERGMYGQLFDEATARHPGYYGIYFEATTYLLPKWNGDADAVEAFARMAARITEASDGASLYARVYWIAIYEQFNTGFPGNSKVDWPLMARGMDDVIARYPSEWNIQNFARFSCLANDRARTRRFFTMMQEVADLDAWNRESNFRNCRDWAKAVPLSDLARALHPTSGD